MGQVKTFRNQLQSNCLWGRDRAPDRPTAGVTVPRTGVPRRPDFGLLSGRCPVLVPSVAKNMLLARTRPMPPSQPVTAALPVGRPSSAVALLRRVEGSCRAVTSHTPRRFSRVSRFLLGFHVLPIPFSEFMSFGYPDLRSGFRIPQSNVPQGPRKLARGNAPGNPSKPSHASRRDA